MSEIQTLVWVNTTLRPLFSPDLERPLVITTVRTWRRKTIADRKKAEAEKAAKEASKPPGKRGPQKRVLPIGFIPERKKGKICNALMLEICNMIMASLTASLPLCRPTLMPQILSVWRHNNITWEPSKAWYTKCLAKPMGLKWRRATMRQHRFLKCYRGGLV